MAEPLTQTSAPSNGAPASATPAQPVAAAAPAPVAAAPKPVTLNDFTELARLSIARETPVTPATATEAQVNEPSPAATETDPAQPTSETPATTETTATEEADPTADEMAGWTESEKKLHGVVVKLRNEIKDLKKASRETAAAPQTEKQPPTAPKAEPTTPAAQVTTAPVADAYLSDCQTFEAVDARVVQAAQYEVEANRLQQMLNRNGVEPVAQRLASMGVEKIGNVPVAEASADQVGDFLATVYENARMVQANAQPRKQWLATNHQSLAEAVKALPDLANKDSAIFKQATQAVLTNPLLKGRADWPMLLVQHLLGKQALANLNKPATAPAAAPVKPAAAPAKKSPPGAPSKTTAAMPSPAKADALKAKMDKGTATLAEVQEYTRLHVGA